ncbi:hypothetical protein Q9251_04215 [Alkalihalobacillus macyae]|uniref:hypothetical protein n=1 Tax=Guptibacillus hwajinpoensis TaxID=208199 RepID=UPI00273C46B5|nr:hypothetical protein [Alkalihalobacillus macyae]MDP4550085.1 hypothetical protein [Alkalihalobacillus macyae]
MQNSIPIKQSLISEAPIRIRKKLLFNFRIMKIYRLVTKQKIVSVLYSNWYDTYILIAQEKGQYEDIVVDRAESGFFKGISLYYKMSTEKGKEPLLIKGKPFLYTLIEINRMHNAYSAVKLIEVVDE